MDHIHLCLVPSVVPRGRGIGSHEISSSLTGSNLEDKQGTVFFVGIVLGTSPVKPGCSAGTFLLLHLFPSQPSGSGRLHSFSEVLWVFIPGQVAGPPAVSIYLLSLNPKAGFTMIWWQHLLLDHRAYLYSASYWRGSGQDSGDQSSHQACSLPAAVCQV